jgi:hypothetical protein
VCVEKIELETRSIRRIASKKASYDGVPDQIELKCSFISQTLVCVEKIELEISSIRRVDSEKASCDGVPDQIEL